MPDNIERTIYKLELDASGYIAGTEQLSASTKKLTDAQERANKALKTNEEALKNSTANLEKSKKDLDTYTGANERYRKQLEKSFKDASANQVKLTQLVAENRKEYERAETAAKNFANIASRATTLQQGTTGGKIPTGPPTGVRSPVQGIENIPKNIEEFNQLAVAIGIAEERMKGLDNSSDEFKLLEPIVKKGREALDLYAKTTEDASSSTLSLRGQLRQGKEELVKLEQAGKGATAQYFELEKRVAKLTDEFNDQQQRIKILASDTKLLDFGKGAITAATSAFQTYASISILAGDESEELQKKTMQLFAAMQLLQSLEQLSNLTRREGIIAVHLQSAAQAVYTSVIGASTGALKAYRIALLSIGVLGAVAAIGFLIYKLNQHNKAIEEAGKKQKLFDDINKEAVKTYGAEVTHLEIIRSKLVDLSLPQAKRIALAKDYNKTADEGNKIDIKQIDNIALINAAIDSNIAKIKQRAIARAAENVIAKKAEDLLAAQFKISKDFPSVFDTGTGPGGGFEFDPVEEIQRLKKNKDFLRDRFKIFALEDLINAKKDFEFVSKTAGGLIDIESLFKTDVEKATKATGSKEVENVFVKTLNGLLDRLRDAGKKEIESVDLIQDEFTDKLVEEINNIDELVAKKQLTTAQGNFLVKILEAVIGKESDAAVQLLKDRIKTAITKLNDELTDLDIKRAQDSVSLLEDEFEKRAAQIDLSESQEIASTIEAGKERLATLEEINASGLLLERDYIEAKKRIISGGELDVLNIVRKAAADRAALAADILKKQQDLIDDIGAEAIAAATEGVKAGETEPTERFQDYVIAIGELAQSVISFWQKANEAEAIALDKSIALQEKRVDAAQRIAARGNAQYLKQEEDRLKELQIKKENAARRELAINAALQASQLLVGITGAIAKIATPGIGIAETIGAMAVIFASLATGYGLVKSLQGTQPKLARGTKSVRRDGHPAGTDTIPAWLNEGEAVIPTHRNRAYHPAVSAIYDGSIPASDMNRFVTNYHKIKGVPQPNYRKISEAAEMHVGQNGQLAGLIAEQNRKIDESNDLHRQTIRTLKKLGVNVSLDANGFAVTQMEVIDQMQKDKNL